jgi:hypothetical protein
LTEGKDPSPASTFLTTVNLGWSEARPPGGRDEHPVANCRKLLRSLPLRLLSTLTKRWNPGLEKKNKKRSHEAVVLDFFYPFQKTTQFKKIELYKRRSVLQCLK